MNKDPGIQYCHICGFIIPPAMVDQRHPLFGTVDHVIPKSKGGKRGKNLRQAHHLCNRIKGCADMSKEVQQVARRAILPFAAMAKIMETKRGRESFSKLRSRILPE